MSTTRSTRLAWALTGLTLALTVASNALTVFGGDRFSLGRDAFIWALTFVFLGAGHVIATRQPGNAIGWLFLGVAVSVGLGSMSGAYAGYWIDTGRGGEIVGQLAAVYAENSWIPFIVVPATFLLLLFPDGRLLSRRWRPFAWLAAAGIAGNFVVGVVRPGPFEDFAEIERRFTAGGLVEVLEPLSMLALVVGIGGSATSVVIRFRRARGVQRQQMKWIAFAGAVAAVTFVVMIALYEVVGEVVANASMMLTVMALPATTALAIVRYRLYDIDVVINRTLVYGSLTATLAGVYVGSVLLLQLALEGLTQGSGLAVAASTLAVAALFGPVRARIQGIVDRRFFRSRYDATRTMEAFGARLRDEVDLQALTAELQAVVGETMRPTHVSLWLRAEEPA
jgi:MFS family permease